jgi:Na+/proline symporter
VGLVLDGGIILLYFAAISAIGLVMGRREKNLRDFALGGRQIPWWAVMASIIAAETSAATFLGAPTEGFKRESLAYVMLTLGVIIGRWVVANYFLAPYYRYKVYTVYDYLEIRFGLKTKSFVSGLFLVMRTLASGTRLFIPSIVMVLAWQVLQNHGQPVVVSQKPVNDVVPYVIAIILVSVLTAIYTTKGGIKAVIWTDVVQASLMFVAALIAVGTILANIGGFDGLVHLVPKMGTLQGYFASGFDRSSVQDWQVSQKMIAAGASPLPMGPIDYFKEIVTNDYTLISALIAASISNMGAFGTDQDMVQRLLTAETQAKSRRSLMTAAVMDIPIATAFTFIGVLLVAFYKLNPSMQPKSTADVFGAYILNVMPAGIRGLVLAGVFATAMGSLSAALNALATSATNDFYVPAVLRRRTIDQEEILRAVRVFTIVFSVLMVVVAGGFAYLKVTNPDIGIIPVVLGVAGYIIGPMLGVFLLGMFTHSRGSDRGNVVALVAGLVATSVLGDLPGKISPSLSLHLAWTVSFTWFAFIGAVVVIAVGIWFKTPEEVLRQAEKRAAQAESGVDDPLAMRATVER